VNGENYIMMNLTVCIPHSECCSGVKIEKSETGWACSEYGGGERRVLGFDGET